MPLKASPDFLFLDGRNGGQPKHNQLVAIKRIELFYIGLWGRAAQPAQMAATYNAGINPATTISIYSNMVYIINALFDNMWLII